MAAGAVPESSRRLLPGALSLAIHGGLTVHAVVLVSHGGGEPPVALTPIEMIEVAPPPPPPPPPEPGTQTLSTANASTGTLGRRGRDAPQRSQTRAPVAADPYADLVVSYDRPTGPDPGAETGTTGGGVGAGLHGDGAGSGDGTGQFGIGNLAVPPPPKSLARPPRPRGNYDAWYPAADRRFVGGSVLVELVIDARGRVRQVTLLRGVDSAINNDAVELARQFEFYPALDEAGQPTTAHYRWEFVLQAGAGASFQPR